MSFTRWSLFGGAALALTAVNIASALQTLPIAPPKPTEPAPPVSQGPKLSDSYQVMCEQGGVRFNLGGGLLLLDPDTLQVTSIAERALDSLPAQVLPQPDIPDRYQAANCSEDGGRTWGRVILDFYVPNFGETSIVHTGYEDAIVGGQQSDEHAEFPAEDEGAFNDLLSRLSELLGTPVPNDVRVQAPGLPALPAPLYTIDVKFRNPAGQVVAISEPGVIGVPTIVPVTAGTLPEGFEVTIQSSQTANSDGTAASSGYALSIQRLTPPNVNATCTRLEADVNVRIALGSPLGSGPAGMIELGYRTLGVSPRAGAPSAFTAKYENSTADTGPTRNDFFVDVSQTPSCGTAEPLDLVGHFVDYRDPATSADDVDLSLDLAMPVATDWTLTRKTDASSKVMITSISKLPLGELTVTGSNKGKQIDATVASIPESLTVCSHKGNQCNRPWRTDRNSEASFYLKARNASDQASPLSVAYREFEGDQSLDLSLWLSDFAYDTYLGRFSWKEMGGIPFVHGDYPKWFFLDTLGTPISGGYHSRSGSHYLNVEMPGHGTRIWNREVVADKKGFLKLILKLDRWGDMVCSSGFSIGLDAGGKIAGYLLGSALCRAHLP